MQELVRCCSLSQIGSKSGMVQKMNCEELMKFVFVLAMLFALNAHASDPPKKGDDKKSVERSAVPERITRPKSTPDSLPQPVEKKEAGEACSKFEYKEKPAKIVCLYKAVGEKPKAAPK
jgi:hypothetical protein